MPDKYVIRVRLSSPPPTMPSQLKCRGPRLLNGGAAPYRNYKMACARLSSALSLALSQPSTC